MTPANKIAAFSDDLAQRLQGDFIVDEIMAIFYNDKLKKDLLKDFLFCQINYKYQ